MSARQTPTVTRHTGTVVTAGGVAYIVGGGYTGSTDELDEQVQRHAAMLADAFGRAVEIRYNTDRRSGGAWLRDGRRGLNASCQVGLNAGYRKILPEDERERERLLTAPGREWSALPDRLLISAYLSAHVCDRRVVNCGTYAYRDFETADDALAWILRNADRSRLATEGV